MDAEKGLGRGLFLRTLSLWAVASALPSIINSDTTQSQEPQTFLLLNFSGSCIPQLSFVLS